MSIIGGLQYSSAFASNLQEKPVTCMQPYSSYNSNKGATWEEEHFPSYKIQVGPHICGFSYPLIWGVVSPLCAP